MIERMLKRYSGGKGEKKESEMEDKERRRRKGREGRWLEGGYSGM